MQRTRVHFIGKMQFSQRAWKARASRNQRHVDTSAARSSRLSRLALHKAKSENNYTKHLHTSIHSAHPTSTKNYNVVYAQYDQHIYRYISQKTSAHISMPNKWSTLSTLSINLITWCIKSFIGYHKKRKLLYSLCNC